MTSLFLRVVISLLLAAVLCKYLGRLVERFVPAVPGGVSIAISFVVIAAIAFAAFTFACVRWLNTDAVVFPMFIDRVGGSILGAATCLAILGVVMILWSLVVAHSPVKIRINEEQLRLDMGAVILKEMDRATNRLSGAESFDAADAIQRYRMADEPRPATKQEKG